MNYRKVMIKDGYKQVGFWWFVFVETILLVVAGIQIIDGKIIEPVLIFILIELREINAKAE
jgi:hypothetical protein